METKKTGYSDVDKLKILKTLSHFLPDDYTRMMEDDEFWNNKFMLDLELAKTKNGTAEFCSLEELDAMLDQTISKYDA